MSQDKNIPQEVKKEKSTTKKLSNTQKTILAIYVFYAYNIFNDLFSAYTSKIFKNNFINFQILNILILILIAFAIYIISYKQLTKKHIQYLNFTNILNYSFILYQAYLLQKILRMFL